MVAVRRTRGTPVSDSSGVTTPAARSARVAVTLFNAPWHGFVLAGRRIDPKGVAWSAAIPYDGGVRRFELAGTEPPDTAFANLRDMLHTDGAHWVLLEDTTAALYRGALLRDGKLLAALFLGPDHTLPPRDWLLSLFAEGRIGLAARHALLAGRLADGAPPSPTLCVCHGMRQSVIEGAIRGGSNTVAAIGAATRAGTGCGSCRPEITALLARVAEPA